MQPSESLPYFEGTPNISNKSSEIKGIVSIAYTVWHFDLMELVSFLISEI